MTQIESYNTNRKYKNDAFYRSILLQEEFPLISNAVRYLPEFDLEEVCKNCTKVKKKKKGKKFKYRKQYVFLEGAHSAISCPEYVMYLFHIIGQQ